MRYLILAEWDPDARVWVAESEDVPGLATGADTIEELVEKLKVIVPELLVENGLLPQSEVEVPFEVCAKRLETATAAH
jgi:predicted RNase H-like HicB family nuclease